MSDTSERSSSDEDDIGRVSEDGGNESSVPGSARSARLRRSGASEHKKPHKASKASLALAELPAMERNLDESVDCAIKAWSVERTCLWLSERGLSQLEPAFQKHRIDGSKLLAMVDTGEHYSGIGDSAHSGKLLLALLNLRAGKSTSLVSPASSSSSSSSSPTSTPQDYSTRSNSDTELSRLPSAAVAPELASTSDDSTTNFKSIVRAKSDSDGRKSSTRMLARTAESSVACREDEGPSLVSAEAATTTIKVYYSGSASSIGKLSKITSISKLLRGCAKTMRLATPLPKTASIWLTSRYNDRELVESFVSYSPALQLTTDDQWKLLTRLCGEQGIESLRLELRL